MDPASHAAENWARRLGFARIAGTDEAGRGALAGPLVAAAVVLPPGERWEGLEGLADSKSLTPGRRRELFSRITAAALCWSYACVSPRDIDEAGLQAANVAAMREAVLSLTPAPDLVLVDYYRLEGLGIPQWSLVHGDRLSRSVAAASILAKVIRDHLMLSWWVRYPEYGFEQHKGYGTSFHRRAIALHGPAPCHRGSFRGVQQMRLGFA
ncbi:MAG: ribonuclease HII [Actinobacteria bacterium]|nr:ribonuclease HII [Actinomycetota bacterium]